MSELKPIIKVLGIGGGGCNAVAYMNHAEILGVEFLAANTDAQDLEKITSIKKIQLGKNVTSGLGAGADPKIGRKSAEENEDEIRESLKGANLLFISAGMGGGTGTGGAPIVAEIAKELGMLVIAVVTKPFLSERKKRMDKAMEGIKNLQDNVDALIIIPNEQLKHVIPIDTPISKVFEEVDQVLYKAIQGISDIVTKRGIINIDFNDLKTIMKDSGSAMIGMGIAQGENKAKEAAMEAINSPLLEQKNLSSAKRAIVNVGLGIDGSLKDFEAVGEIVKSFTAEDAEVITGTSIDETLGDQIKVTIIATDFEFEKEENKPIIIQEEKLANTQEQKEEDQKEDLPAFIKRDKNKNENKDTIEVFNEEVIDKEKTEQEKDQIDKTNEEKTVNNVDFEIPNFLKKRL